MTSTMTEWNRTIFRPKRTTRSDNGCLVLCWIACLLATSPGDLSAQGVCDRTPQVRDKLVEVAGVSDCSEVAVAHLAGVTTLNVRESRIESIQSHDFRGLVNLEQLVLTSNSLRELPEDAFAGLDSLVDLQLDWNELRSLPEGVFSGLRNLQQLNLRVNRLRELPEEILKGLNSLIDLQLNWNPLKALPQSVFEETGNLQRLMLDTTLLRQLPEGIFDGLNNLQELNLDRNGNLTVFPPGIFDDALATLGSNPDNEGLEVRSYLKARLTFAPDTQRAAPGQTVKATVTLHRVLPVAVRVPYTVGGSATADNPIGLSPTPEEGVLFLAGETRKDITFTLPETADLLGKTVVLTLGQAAEIGLRRADGTGSDAPFLKSESLVTPIPEAATQVVSIFNGFPDSDLGGICDRTPQVRDTLVTLSGETACSSVTREQLSRVTTLNLREAGISTLQPDDFSGLNSLTDLSLWENHLTILPAEIFAGLGKLERLEIPGNALHTLPEGIFDGLKNLKWLDLRGNYLTTLREDAFDGLTNLETLWINTNSFETLPDRVFQGLTNLKEISLNFSFLSTLPVDVFQGLTNLETLELTDNTLTTLPEGIFQGLTSLDDLFISGNLLRELPEGVFRGLTKIDSLWMGGNFLRELPAGIFSGLTNLRSLIISENSLISIPEGIFDGLSNVQDLWLGHNLLRTLPEGIFQDVNKLESLLLHENSLTSLPGGIFSGLRSLGTLWLVGNRLTVLPAGVFDDSLATLSSLLIDRGFTASLGFASTAQTVSPGSDVKVPLVLSRTLPVAVRVPYSVGVNAPSASLRGLSPAPESGVMFRAGETHQEISFRLVNDADSRSESTVTLSLDALSKIGLRRSDGKGEDAPYLETDTLVLRPPDGVNHTVTVPGSDSQQQTPYCLSLWGGAPCSTVSILPGVFAGPMGENPAETEVVITNMDPQPVDCEIGLLFHAGIPSAPAVTFNGRFHEKNLIQVTVPKGGAEILTLGAPDAEELAVGALYVFARSPCGADSLQVQARYLIDDGIEEGFEELFSMPGQSAKDWLRPGECRRLTGIFGNGRNVVLASANSQPEHVAPPGTALRFHAFDLKGKFVGRQTSLDIEWNPQIKTSWEFDRPTIIQMCLDAPSDSQFKLAIAPIGSKSGAANIQYATESFRNEPEPEDTGPDP